MTRILYTLSLAAFVFPTMICLLMGCGGGSSNPTIPSLNNPQGGLGSGLSADDDGTADQGSGDAPGTPGADDSFGGDDDGTADQGSGDAPGTPGADDGVGGDDDGTADQGHGDH